MTVNVDTCDTADDHWLQELEDAVRELGVPGAVLGILRDGEISTYAAGVLGAESRVEATKWSVFQYGSIGKVWTATLIMQLVDEGRLLLDDPVQAVLPDFRVGSFEVSRRVTTRQLLSHGSGIEGDIFRDTGRGDDCVQRYVDGLAGAGQLLAPDQAFSYCNAGFVVAGRIVEVLTGGTWDDAIRTRIAQPLGLRATVTLPEDALLHRAAIGHLPDENGALQQAKRWMFPRAIGPAGLVSGTAEDLLVFVRMHLDGGVSAMGTRVLSAESARAMTERHNDLPEHREDADSWGLGWFRSIWSGHLVLGHDGVTIGQQAFLRALPSRSIAVTVLTNGGRSAELADRLMRLVFSRLAGVHKPHPPAPSPEPIPGDVAQFAGTYRRVGTRFDVSERGGTLSMRVTLEDALAPGSETVKDHVLLPVAPHFFVYRSPHASWWVPVRFFSLPGGSDYLYSDLRSTPKVAAAPQ